MPEILKVNGPFDDPYDREGPEPARAYRSREAKELAQVANHCLPGMSYRALSADADGELYLVCEIDRNGNPIRSITWWDVEGRELVWDE